jgi:hypothetical protein
LSDNDAVFLQIDNGYTSFHAASIYLDYNEPKENNIKTFEKIINFTKGAKLIIAMDSNSRSITWHDVLTNSRVTLLEESLASDQLHIINEERARTRFKNSRVSSNIDLAIVNNQMLAAIKDGDIRRTELLRS